MQAYASQKFHTFEKNFRVSKVFRFFVFNSARIRYSNLKLENSLQEGFAPQANKTFSESFAFLSIAPKNTPFLRFFPTK